MNASLIPLITQAFYLLGHIAILVLVLIAWFRRKEPGIMLIGIGSAIGVLSSLGSSLLIYLQFNQTLAPWLIAISSGVVSFLSILSIFTALVGWALLAFKKPPPR